MPRRHPSRRQVSTFRGVLLVLILLLGAGLVYVATATHTMTFTESQLQEKLSQKIPLTTEDGTIIESLGVHLHDEVSVHTVVSGTRMFVPFRATADADGALEYNNEYGELYFVPSSVEITELNLGTNEAPTDTSAATSEEAEATLLASLLTTAKQAQGDVSEALDAQIRTVASSLTQRSLERQPIYTLSEDLRGSTARMSLKSISIEGDTLVVTFSFLKITAWVIGIVLLIVLMIVMEAFAPGSLEIFFAIFELIDVFST